MRMVIALGGNAILRRGERGTVEEQRHHAGIAASHLARIVQEGHRILITHGNGPQVGDILLKDECASPTLPRMPLDVCGAESQGMIGYLVQQALENSLVEAGIHSRVMTVITQAVVNPADPAFRSPEKPIGPYYTGPEASSLEKSHGWVMREEPGPGFRRVVPSPLPVDIIERDTIRILFEEGFIVIASGGGGIPVMRDRIGKITGVEAVIDKDWSASLLAIAASCEALLILTDVPCAYTGYGTPGQSPLGRITVQDARKHLGNGEFAAGSMAPKVGACIRFIESGGMYGIITSLEDMEKALSGEAGTWIVG